MQCTSKEMTIFIQSLCLREKAILFSAERGIYRGKIFSEGAWSALCSHSCGAGNFTLQHRPQLQPYHSISINASKTLTHKVYRWEKHYFSGTRNVYLFFFFFVLLNCDFYFLFRSLYIKFCEDYSNGKQLVELLRFPGHSVAWRHRGIITKTAFRHT